jgi:hypothetical protein
MRIELQIAAIKFSCSGHRAWGMRALVSQMSWIWLVVWRLAMVMTRFRVRGNQNAKIQLSVLLLLRHEMNSKEAIIQAIDRLPTSRLPDLLLFIQELQEETAMEPWAGALMSESSLQKDWLLPEEDEAWQDL